MRILVLSINYWPDETGIASVNIWRCEYLASRGHQVAICTGPPYYPEWRVPGHYRGGPWEKHVWRTEERNGVTILRSWMHVPRELNTGTRILHEASFLASSFARACFARMPGGSPGSPASLKSACWGGRPELILAVSPPLGLAVTASTLARQWRVPFVFDVEDLQPDAAVELGMMKQGAVVRALYGIERMAYRRAALVSTITEGMRQRIIGKLGAGKGSDPGKVVLFPSRADASLYTLRERDVGERLGAAFRERHGLHGKFIVSHSGNMGVKQGLEVVLGAAERSRRRPDIHYLFVGDGAMRAELQAQTRARSLRNVLFLRLLERDEFRQMLAATDIALITQQRVVSNIVFPSKTVTLLCAGCPVIASVNSESEVARAVLRSRAGEVVEPEDADALFESIDRLSKSPETLARMSARGRQFAQENWDERRTLPRMEEQLVQCVERQNNQP